MSLNRKKEREIVFQMLYAARFHPEDQTEDLFEALISQCETEGAAESGYIREVFCGARDYTPEALEKIDGAAQGWKTSRLSKITLTILVLALYEMEKREDVPVKIAINEAVELAKKFDEEGSRKFVNGILGTLAGA